ncbi:MAG: hypothetical protein ABIH03_06845 [Pseudomonadota bacterium]
MTVSGHCADCDAWTACTAIAGKCARRKAKAYTACHYSCSMFRARVAFREPSGELRDSPPAGAPESDRLPEPELQRRVEKMLEARGYWRLTPAHYARAAQSGLPAGWFAHWHGAEGARGQPQVADLLILDADMCRCRMVELKPAGAIRWQAGQRDAVRSGAWSVAQTLQESARIVDAFERERPYAGGQP